MVKSSKTVARQTIACVALAAVSILAPSLAFAQAADVGIAAAVRNDVTVQSVDEAESRQAVPSQQIFLGDNVRSGEQAALQILFKDETVFTVGENSDMIINEYIYDPASAGGSLVTTVQKGVFRFMTGRIASDQEDNVQINSRVGVIGVRGTMLDLVVGEQAVELARNSGMVDGIEEAGEEATLLVLRGPGRNQSGLNRDGGAYIKTNDGQLTLWKNGTAAFVPNVGGRIVGPIRVTDQMFLALTESLISSQPNQLGTTPSLPRRDLDRVIRDNPDLRQIRRPLPPGGSGSGACPGECPNGQDSGDQPTGQTF